MSDFDDLLQANRAFADSFDLGGFDGKAHAGIALVTCMDSRIDPLAMLGLKPLLPPYPAAAAQEAAANELSEAMAEQWAAMVDDGSRNLSNKASGERVLSQEEIDNLLGFSVGHLLGWGRRAHVSVGTVMH